MEENIREKHGEPEPQYYPLSARSCCFQMGQKVTLKNNFIFDLVNFGEFPPKVNEIYPQKEGKITGIFFAVTKNRYFYGVCPDGKDENEPGTNIYYSEEALIENMKDFS